MIPQCSSRVVFALLTLLNYRISPTWASEFSRGYTVIVLEREVACYGFHLPSNATLHFEYSVLNSNPNNGQPLNILAYVKNPKGDRIFYKYDSATSHLDDYRTQNSEGEYEFCFSNTVSYSYVRTVYWEIIVENMVDEDLEEKLIIMEDVEEDAAIFSTSLFQVQKDVHRMIQYLRMSKVSKVRDSRYLEATIGMIDTWSIVHGGVIISAVAGQVLILKSLFKSAMSPQRTHFKA